MHQSSYDEMQDFRTKYLTGKESENLVILDIGSMDVNGTYHPLFSEPAWEYTGLDMATGPNVDVVPRNPYAWTETASDSVDVLISGQALEHVEFFWLTMQEIARVLKPGGLCCIIAPSGGVEHRYPVDCWRFYPDGFRALARYVEFDTISVVTHWEGRGYSDGSDTWQDTVMICRKPPYALPHARLSTSRQSILRRSIDYFLRLWRRARRRIMYSY